MPDSSRADLMELFHGVGAVPGSTSLRDVATSIYEDPITLDLKTEADAVRLSEFGVSRGVVEAIAGEDMALERQLRRFMLGDAFLEDAFSTPMDDAIRSTVESEAGVRQLAYVSTIAQGGRFLTLCPVSGRAVASEGSFVVDQYHIAYRFSGAVIFFLLVGRFHGRRSALCFPALNLLITLDAPERGPAIARWVGSVMHRLIGLSLEEPERFRRRMNTNRDDLTLVAGGMPNFGHHAWQELSGMSQFVDTQSVTRVRSILLGPHTWFPLDKVFPELAEIDVTRCSSAEEMLVKGLDRPGTILRPVGVQIDEGLRVRLSRAAAFVIGTAESERIDKLGMERCLIWINLRAHNKRWLSQIDGYAGLLNQLQSEFGNIGVVYDGLQDTADLRDEIDRQLQGDITRHDTIGASIETSLAWANAVSTYVSVVGSGLVLNSWLVRKPGVAHANRTHLRQRSFWNMVSREMIHTTFINPAEVTCDGTGYGNYDFDWRVLVPHLRNVCQQTMCER